jgi:feruloyl esterase
MLKTAESGRSGGSGGESACRTIATVLICVAAATLHAQSAPSAESCAALAKVSLPQVTIVSATLVAAGALPPPPARGGGPGGATVNPFADLPAVCRVAATLKPSADSEIKMELWLPATWNGKFKGTGNGGLGGGAGVGLNALAAGVAADTRRRGTTPVTTATRATRWSTPSASRTSGTAPRTR